MFYNSTNSYHVSFTQCTIDIAFTTYLALSIIYSNLIHKALINRVAFEFERTGGGSAVVAWICPQTRRQNLPDD